MLLLASGSLIAPVFASILRSVETRVSNLLVDLLTTDWVPPQLSPSRPRPLYFGVGSWEQHLFPPLQGWAGRFDAPLPTNAGVLGVSPFACSRSPHPLPPPTPPYFGGRGPEYEINTPSGDRSLKQLPALESVWRTARTHLPPKV